eukprot:scaffold88843_cov31-Tisochrysis_lutea.AAC.3
MRVCDIYTKVKSIGIGWGRPHHSHHLEPQEWPRRSCAFDFSISRLSSNIMAQKPIGASSRVIPLGEGVGVRPCDDLWTLGGGAGGSGGVEPGLVIGFEREDHLELAKRSAALDAATLAAEAAATSAARLEPADRCMSECGGDGGSGGEVRAARNAGV